MNGKHINVAGLKASAIRHKVLCIIMALSLVMLMIPHGLCAHAETTTDPEPQTTEQQSSNNGIGGDTDQENVPEEEIILPENEETSLTVMFVAIGEDSFPINSIKFYDITSTGEEKEISVNEPLTVPNGSMPIPDDENEFVFIIEAETQIEHYISPVYDESQYVFDKWMSTDVMGMYVLTACFKNASIEEQTYNLYATNPDGLMSCTFLDNSEPMEYPSFRSTQTPQVEDSRLIYYKGSEQHIIEITDIPEDYEFYQWDIESSSAGKPINVFATFLRHDTFVITLNGYSEDGEAGCTFAEYGDPLLDNTLYTVEVPDVSNNGLYYRDTHDVVHEIRIDYIYPENYIFSKWEIEQTDPKNYAANCILEKGVPISGQLIEAETNAPVANALIDFYCNETHSYYSAISDVDGKFTVYAPKNSTGILFATADGHTFIPIEITEPIDPEKGTQLGPIKVITGEEVEFIITPTQEDAHLCFEYYFEISGQEADYRVIENVDVRDIVPGTTFSFDENGIITAIFVNPNNPEMIETIILTPIAVEGYKFASYYHGSEKLVPNKEYKIIPDEEGCYELSLNYEESADKPTVSIALGASDYEQHEGFDWALYANEEIVDYDETADTYLGSAYPGTLFTINKDGSIESYYTDEDGIEWVLELECNPADGYQFDYYEVVVDGEVYKLEPDVYEIPSDLESWIIFGNVHYKKAVEIDDVLIAIGPADYEQHDGFNWALYANDEMADYGEDEILYMGEASVGTKFVVDEDGFVESHYLDEDGIEWVLELECNPADGYAFDYYEIYVDGKSYKLEAGKEYEIPEVETIYGTVNYKEVGPSPTPGPKPKPHKRGSYAHRSPKTGDAIPFALVGGIAILAMVSAGYVLSRKFNK